MDTATVFRPTAQSGYTLAGGTLVVPATAVASPTNAASGVTAGQFGGQGMAMPAGATAAAPAAGYGNILSGLFTQLGEAAGNYVKASAMKDMAPIPPSPQASLAEMPIVQPPYAQGNRPQVIA